MKIKCHKMGIDFISSLSAFDLHDYITKCCLIADKGFSTLVHKIGFPVVFALCIYLTLFIKIATTRKRICVSQFQDCFFKMQLEKCSKENKR